MKTWTYATNSYYKTATYILEEGPWYSFFIEHLIQTLCDAFSVLPIPFGSKIKIKDEEVYTLNEYYGSLGSIFHVYVCDPVSIFCYKKRKETYINVNYEQLKKERQWEAPELFEEE